MCEKEGRKRGSQEVVHLVSTDEEKRQIRVRKKQLEKTKKTVVCLPTGTKTIVVWGGGGGGGE